MHVLLPEVTKIDLQAIDLRDQLRIFTDGNLRMDSNDFQFGPSHSNDNLIDLPNNKRLAWGFGHHDNGPGEYKLVHIPHASGAGDGPFATNCWAVSITQKGGNYPLRAGTLTNSNFEVFKHPSEQVGTIIFYWFAIGDRP